MKAGRKIRWTGRRTRAAVSFSVSLVVAVVVAVPFLWMLFTSLKTYPEIYRFPITYFPHKVTFEHYVSIFRSGNLHRYIINSAVVSVGAVGLTLLLSCLPAYAFARMKVKNSRVLLPTVIFCMVLPQVVLLIPFLRVLRLVGLIDTHFGLILVYLTITTPTAIWFLVGFFRSIPDSLEDAAMIDGCGRLQTLVRIVLPIMKPGIGAVAIYTFFLAWNEFMFALSYLSSSRTLTLPIYLGRFVGQYQTRWGELFAGAVVAYAVPLVAFALLQRQFVAALVKGAVKE